MTSIGQICVQELQTGTRSDGILYLDNNYLIANLVVMPTMCSHIILLQACTACAPWVKME